MTGASNYILKILFTFSVTYFFFFNPVEAAPSLWEIEFAKQLATVSEQPFGNGFEEMIQWTKEGKLWEFPVNNEAGKSYCRSSEQSPPAIMWEGVLF